MQTIPDTQEPPRPDSGTIDTFATRHSGMVVTDDLRIRDYWLIVYRRRWIVLAIMVAGLMGGGLYNWLATPIFAARATLQIETDPNVLALDRPLMDQRDWAREFLPTQLGILASRDLARAAHEALTLSDEALPAHEGKTQLPTVGEILLASSAEGIKDTRLVNIGFSSTDPVMAARVANALAEAYVRRSLGVRSQTSADAFDWLAKQVKQQRKVVEESEAALQRYRKERGADELFTDKLGSEQQNIVVQRLFALQGEVSKARAETIGKEVQYKQLAAIEADHRPLDTLPAIASNVFIQGLKAELSTLQRQLVQASEVYGEHHPEIIKLQGAVQNAEQKLQTEISKTVQAIRNDFEAAQSRDRELMVALERQKMEVQALNGKAVEYTALEREATSNREVLDKLLQRSKEASLARELQSTNVKIVDSAEIPKWPILPRKQRTIMLAFAISGALALGLVFLLEMFNTRMTSPADVKRHLQISVLGVVPQLTPKRQDVKRHLHINGHLSLLRAPRFAELLRGVRTNLVMACGLATERTLLVTSSEPGEGKTMATANLAMSLAQLNQRVLLIDADMRKPRLHELFGQKQQPGLAEVLTGNDEVSGTVTTSALHKTQLARLWLMPSGSAARNPADLLGSERFSKLINILGSQFDWVVIDSPPILAVTDACLIARVASRVLLVVDCRNTSQEVASAAVERLDAVGATLVGAMLNRVALDRRGESYLPYYHRNYQSYYPQHESSAWLTQIADAPSKGDSARTAAPMG